MKFLHASCAGLAAITLGFVACSRAPSTPANARPWRDFVDDLTRVEKIAKLDGAGTQLLSTYDRSGGNDDFNYFQKPGTEAGWFVLTDLKGPGCVRRMWVTGMDGLHPFRFYFDGEKVPRLAGTTDEMFGGKFPHIVPLARCLNMCWYSYLPLTYQKSLRIETKQLPVNPGSGPGRLFFQINAETLAATQAVESLPKSLTAEDRAAVERSAAAWTMSVLPQVPAMKWDQAVIVAPGQTGVVFSARGPAIVSQLLLDVQPVDSAAWPVLEKEALEQDVLLRVSYDGEAFSSIETPVGYFFANSWRRRTASSLVLSSSTTGFTSRLPMPFKKDIRIEIVNHASQPVRAVATGDVAPRSEGDWGFLHVAHSRTGPAPGKPHVFADFQGRGKLVGTVLDVSGLENSWWILEGDESIFVDGETRPSWHGTGLEDYFNGGWYYRSAAFAAVHGILDRAPFRVGQYRFHLTDPVAFSKSLHMEIERGDQNISHGFFQSSVFAYLDAPRPVPPVSADAAQRRTADHPYYRQTFMLQLTELERMNNFDRARDAIQEYAARFPDAEENGVYRLRAMEYGLLEGAAPDAAAYEPFIRGDHGAQAASEARMLRWFHEKSGRALVGANINAKGEAFIDGQKVLEADHPYALAVQAVELGGGTHALSVRADIVRGDPWVQAAVRTSDGLIGTGMGTPALSAPQAQGNWMMPTADLATWARTEQRNILRGTPDAPYIGSVPNAFVLLQSKAYSIRAPDWGYAYRGPAYFSIPLKLPLGGWPAARDMTGLEK